MRYLLKIKNKQAKPIWEAEREHSPLLAHFPNPCRGRLEPKPEAGARFHGHRIPPARVSAASVRDRLPGCVWVCSGGRLGSGVRAEPWTPAWAMGSLTTSRLTAAPPRSFWSTLICIRHTINMTDFISSPYFFPSSVLKYFVYLSLQ